MRDLANSTITIKQCISEDPGSIQVVYLSHSEKKNFRFFFLPSFLVSLNSFFFCYAFLILSSHKRVYYVRHFISALLSYIF